jgi:hypothetical protein
MARIELATSRLPSECSATELHGQDPDCNGSGAGEGNRTLVVSLEGFCSAIELHPRCLPAPTDACPESYSLVEGEGFEPSKAEPSDLQSDPFDRSGTPPNQ